MRKIGFVNVCHPEYDYESAKSVADEVVKSLENQDNQVQVIENPVMDPGDGLRAGCEMARSDVDGVVIMLGTWVECAVVMAVIREIEHLPFCLYGHPVLMLNGRRHSSGSNVSLIMLKGSLDRAGYRYRYFLGSPEDPETMDALAAFCRAASAKKALRRSRVGLVGYSSMSIYPGTFDHLLMRTRIGPEVKHIDAYTLIRKAEAIEDAACEPVMQSFRDAAEIMDDVTNADLLKCAKLYLAIKQLVREDRLDAITVKCQYEFSKEYSMVLCVPLSLMADTGAVTSCEGDMPVMVSMLMMHLLSGQTVTYGDLLDIKGRVISLSPCGFAPYSLGVKGTCRIRKFMPHPGFNGIQNSFVLKPGLVTIMRLVEDIGSYHIIYSIGKGLNSELRDGCMPNLDIEISSDIEQFIKHCSGQHFAIGYGDLGAEIEDLAAMLNIQAVRI